MSLKSDAGVVFAFVLINTLGKMLINVAWPVSTIGSQRLPPCCPFVGAFLAGEHGASWIQSSGFTGTPLAYKDQ